MTTYLDGIVAWHRARAGADGRPAEVLAERARRAPLPRDFRGALAGGRAERRPRVIAEVKRRSPSRGDLAVDLDPARLAREYELGGAACLSVLTDAPHFGGSPDDLARARVATVLPVLRKDFTVSPVDLYDARVMGADAVLLIVAALSDAELISFLQLARELSLAALVEVHDGAETRRALRAGADLIGVNQRDLHTFEVDHKRALELAALLPADVVRVAESGIRQPGDVERLAAAGFDAVLVGETLVTATDPVATLKGLLGTEAVV